MRKRDRKKEVEKKKRKKKRGGLNRRDERARQST